MKKVILMVISLLCMVSCSSGPSSGEGGASPSANTFTVTFHASEIGIFPGGGLSHSVEVENEKVVAKPDFNTYDWYELDGWYSEDGYKWNFYIDRVACDIELYAKPVSELVQESDTEYSLNGVTYEVSSDGVEVTGHTNDIPKTLTLIPEIEGKPVTSIGRSAFYDSIFLESVTIPDTVTQIGEYACSGCVALKSFNLPEGVVSMGTGTFRFCDDLVNVSLPSTLTIIPESCFSGASSLASMVIKKEVVCIGKYAFSNCSSLTSVTFENTEDWLVDRSAYSELSGDDLKDRATAANYLADKYDDYLWAQRDYYFGNNATGPVF